MSEYKLDKEVWDKLDRLALEKNRQDMEERMEEVRERMNRKWENELDNSAIAPAFSNETLERAITALKGAGERWKEGIRMNLKKQLGPLSDYIGRSREEIREQVRRDLATVSDPATRTFSLTMSEEAFEEIERQAPNIGQAIAEAAVKQEREREERGRPCGVPVSVQMKTNDFVKLDWNKIKAPGGMKEAVEAMERQTFGEWEVVTSEGRKPCECPECEAAREEKRGREGVKIQFIPTGTPFVDPHPRVEYVGISNGSSCPPPTYTPPISCEWVEEQCRTNPVFESVIGRMVWERIKDLREREIEDVKKQASKRARRNVESDILENVLPRFLMMLVEDKDIRLPANLGSPEYAWSGDRDEMDRGRLMGGYVHFESLANMAVRIVDGEWISKLHTQTGQYSWDEVEQAVWQFEILRQPLVNRRGPTENPASGSKEFIVRKASSQLRVEDIAPVSAVITVKRRRFERYEEECLVKATEDWGFTVYV